MTTTNARDGSAPSAGGEPGDRRPLAVAGLVLGTGMGGFVDGILFHQILQTHNMISARRPPTSLVNVEAGMVWDGLFHLFTWAATALGIALLYLAARQRGAVWSSRMLMGAMLAGWGAFNLVEGVIDHHVLHVHHVVERLGPSAYDWVFLGSGVVLIAAGGLLVRSADTRARIGSLDSGFRGTRSDAGPGPVNL